MTKKCENCGTVLDKGDIHCPECGEQYNPKPVINKGTLIGLILLTWVSLFLYWFLLLTVKRLRIGRWND